MIETDNKAAKIMEKYLNYYRDQWSKDKVSNAKRILTGFKVHLQTSNISLCNISIEQVDGFLAFYNKNYISGRLG
jgi:hypothetical protein